ncbi:MAG: response regulator transcription factor, partial [Chloroflexota bacterium]
EQSYRMIEDLGPVDGSSETASAIRWNLEDTASPGPLAAGLGFIGRYREVFELLGVDPNDPAWMDRLNEGAVGPLAYAGLAFSLAGMGYPREARAVKLRAREVARSARDWVLVGASGFWEICYITLPYFTDRPVECDQIASESAYAMRMAEGAQGGWPPDLCYIFAHFEAARWSELERFIADLNPRTLLIMTWHAVLWITAEIARARGDADAAWKNIREVLPWGASTDPGNSVFLLATRFQRLAVHLALDAGKMTRAAEWLAAHDRWLDWNGAVQGRAAGEVVRARYELARGDIDRARETALRGLELAGNPRQPLTLMRAHRKLAEVERQCRRFEDAQEHVDCALELGRISATRYEQALNRLTWAELRLETGRTEDLRAEVQDTREFLAELGAQPAVTVADRLLNRLDGEFPAGLTAREVEVLRLLTDGLSNSEIALELSISPRTVDHHLRSIYRKLDVHSRAGAIRFAIQNDLA